MMDWPTGPYDVICADPPWSYRSRNQFGFAGDVGVTTGGAVSHYTTMSVDEIAALPVPQLCAPDALLFLWVTSPCLPDGLTVMEAWGFRWATVGFVWDKQAINPGYYTLSQVELCCIGKRGRIPRPRGARNVRQFVSSARRQHSAKPSEVRAGIEAMFPGQRKLELFARSRPPGWDVWGNQVDLLPAESPDADPRQLDLMEWLQDLAQ